MLEDTEKYYSIQIKDNEKGIDPNQIYKKAIEKGIALRSKINNDQEKINFIFENGFSTKQDIVITSRRAIGMNIIKKNIKDLGGKLNINSSPGKGTIFTIRLPKLKSKF